jgi:hypothetical protein
MACAPGIDANFPFDFPQEGDVFTCLGETLILAAHDWSGNFAIGHFDQKLVDQIAAWGDKLGFKSADFRTFNKLVSKEKIAQIKSFYRHHHAALSGRPKAETWISKTA